MTILEYNTLCKKYGLGRYAFNDMPDNEYTYDYVCQIDGRCIRGYRRKVSGRRNLFCVYKDGTASEWTSSAKRAETMLDARIREIKDDAKQRRIQMIEEL